MTTIIAEFGSSPAPAWDFEPWCRAAAMSGADGVKVQLFRAEHFPEAEQASKRPLEFPRDRLGAFVDCAHAFGVSAGASVFDDEAVMLVAENCDWLKLASREIDNAALQLAALKAAWPIGKWVYRSMPRLVAKDMQGGVVNLGVVPEYPAALVPSCLTVLKAASFFRQWVSAYSWGWSSHTRGILDCWLAAALGAAVIEKHFCLTTADSESGHSLLPPDFARMVRAVRRVERN